MTNHGENESQNQIERFWIKNTQMSQKLCNICIDVNFQELEEIKLMPYPAYSPNLFPSDYYLFWFMAHLLCSQHFNN